MAIAQDNQKTPSGKHPIPDIIMLLAILWLRLPVALGSASSTSVHILVLSPFVLGISVLLPLPRPSRTVSLLGVLVGIFVLMIVIALLRGASAGVYESVRHVIFEDLGICLLVVFGYLYFASAVTESDWAHRMFILCCAPGTYVAINAILHLAGFHGPTAPGEPVSVLNSGTPAQLLGLVGIHSTRVLFPLANGIDNFGDISGVAMVISVVLVMRAAGRQRLIAALLLIGSLYALLAADARGALLFSIVATVLVLLLGRRRWLAGLAFLIPLTTVISEFELTLVSHTSLVGTFSRKGTDLLTATERTAIWRAVFHVLSHPSLTQLYGYGTNGQISSGASINYAHLFTGSAHPDRYTAHNFMLQTILDVGYAGLLVFVFLVFFTARDLQRMIVSRKSNPAMALMGALVFLIFAGATDGPPSIYTPETLYFLFLVVTAVAATRTTFKRRQRSYLKVNQTFTPSVSMYHREIHAVH
jgi:O-antigen ligase